ncbi:hypothetical protein M427DRAFT_154408 [Gonapodya prolifera JEL478]|uniref:SH3 domain-containing protein n=1 Tax=Gonapodya prolifera (strain JEL478) TaxID=1344416 RepID=A0A139AID7_GONPJ|nr:hypothetical protein M427DRAFT_154408 [Gonapodya prolifera JEL478]|eukprot:KXS16469.1 hypothetical protein M427DRAFT_154408 [Gonapodya prolifera JEL478]
MELRRAGMPRVRKRDRSTLALAAALLCLCLRSSVSAATSNSTTTARLVPQTFLNCTTQVQCGIARPELAEVNRLCTLGSCQVECAAGYYPCAYNWCANATGGCAVAVPLEGLQGDSAPLPTTSSPSTPYLLGNVPPRTLIGVSVLVAGAIFGACGIYAGTRIARNMRFEKEWVVESEYTSASPGRKRGGRRRIVEEAAHGHSRDPSSGSGPGAILVPDTPPQLSMDLRASSDASTDGSGSGAGGAGDKSILPSTGPVPPSPVMTRPLSHADSVQPSVSMDARGRNSNVSAGLSAAVAAWARFEGARRSLQLAGQAQGQDEQRMEAEEGLVTVALPQTSSPPAPHPPPRSPAASPIPDDPTLLSHFASLLPPVLTHADLPGVPAPSKAVVQPGKVYIAQRGYKAEREGEVGVGPRDQVAVTGWVDEGGIVEGINLSTGAAGYFPAIVLIKDEASARREAERKLREWRCTDCGCDGTQTEVRRTSKDGKKRICDSCFQARRKAREQRTLSSISAGISAAAGRLSFSHGRTASNGVPLVAA